MTIDVGIVTGTGIDHAPERLRGAEEKTATTITKKGVEVEIRKIRYYLTVHVVGFPFYALHCDKLTKRFLQQKETIKIPIDEKGNDKNEKDTEGRRDSREGDEDEIRRAALESMKENRAKDGAKENADEEAD